MGAALWVRPAKAIWSEYPTASECHFPTVVHLRTQLPNGEIGVCTGVYLGEDLVITAAHCIHAEGAPLPDTPYVTWVFFGDSYPGAALWFDAACVAHPEYQANAGPFAVGVDLAVCTLEERDGGDTFWDLDLAFGQDPGQTGSVVWPMIPDGCERDVLRERVYQDGPFEAIFVGWGRDAPLISGDSPDYGEKRFVSVDFQGQFSAHANGSNFPGSLLRSAQPEPYACTEGAVDRLVTGGDSGGPLFVEADDGALRLVGIAHASDAHPEMPGICPAAGEWAQFVHYEPVPSHLRWIEQTAGVDVPPCFDFVPGEGWVFDPECTDYHGNGRPQGKVWDAPWGCYDAADRVPVTRCGGAIPPPIDDITVPGVPSSGTDLDWAVALARDPAHLRPPPPPLFAGGTLATTFGTHGEDVLLGSAGPEAPRAGGGNDLLLGGAGNDALLGGAGNDALSGGPGDDAIAGGPGNDVIFAGPGDDTVALFHLCEASGAEVIVGGPGDDTVIAPVGRHALLAAEVLLVGVERVVVAPELAARSGCAPRSPEDGAQFLAGHGGREEVQPRSRWPRGRPGSRAPRLSSWPRLRPSLVAGPQRRRMVPEIRAGGPKTGAAAPQDRAPARAHGAIWTATAPIAWARPRSSIPCRPRAATPCWCATSMATAWPSWSLHAAVSRVGACQVPTPFRHSPSSCRASNAPGRAPRRPGTWTVTASKTSWRSSRKTR